MILILKSGSVFKGTIGKEKIDAEGNTFPLISLPINEPGSPTELNDFQWWAYTDQWNQWLKKNPRAWTAESEESQIDKVEKIWEDLFNTPNPYAQFFNFQISSISKKGRLSSFDEFTKLYEEKDSDASGITKKFIKLGYAIESLAKAGKMKADLSINEIKEGEKIAVVVDFRDEEGTPIPESRQALRYTKIKDVGKLSIGSVDYGIPIGEIKDDVGSILKKVGEYAAAVLVGGVAVGSLILVGKLAGGLAGGWALRKGFKGVYRNLSKSKTISNVVSKPGAWSKVKNFGSAIFGRGTAGSVASAARTVLPSGAYVEGGLAYNAAGTALRGAASSSVKQAAARTVAAGATRGAAGAGLAAAEASNPIGWVVAAVTAIAGTGQQLYNWLSDKQAPRFSDVDDFAKGTFKPSEIPVGKPITICWTSDGGAGFWGGVLKVLTFSKDDTRTTMNIIKIGNFDNRSLFILTDVHSKSMEQTLKENDLILLAFNNRDSFERGFLDNDDLEFNTIAIPDMSQFMISTSFVGYCNWGEMQEAYKKAPDVPFYTPKNAPSEYAFNYDNNKGERINVNGLLLSSSELEQMNIDELLPTSTTVAASESFRDYKNYKLVNENSKVFSFSEFSNSLILEVDNEDAKSNKDIDDETVAKWIEDYSNAPNVAKAEKIKSEQDESPYGQVSMPVYKATEIQFVDPNSKGESPRFRYFIVGDESLDAEQDEAINVEVTSDDPVNVPRYGLASYTPPPPPAGEEDEESDTEIEPIQVQDPEGDKVFVTNREDVDIKQKRRSLVISDYETEDEEDINIIDEFVTAADRKELGIEDWKNLTKITVRYDNKRNPLKVILRNKFGGFDKVRRIKKGEAGFDAAINFIAKVKSGIKYN